MELIALYSFYTHCQSPKLLYTPPDRGIVRWLHGWQNTQAPGWTYWRKPKIAPFTYQYLNGLGFCRTHRSKTNKVRQSHANAWERRVLLHGLLEAYCDRPLTPHVIDTYDDDLTLPFGYQQWPTKDEIVAETYVSRDGGRVVLLHDRACGTTLLCISATREQLPKALLTLYAEKQPVQVTYADFDDANLNWPLKPVELVKEPVSRWTQLRRELSTAFVRFWKYEK